MRLRTAARGGRVELKHEFKQDPNRVYRGGSWFYSADYARAAFRDRLYPGSRDGLLGLRHVRDQGSPRENE